MPKPFIPIELVARVKAQLRRSKEFNHSEAKNVLEYLDLSMNLEITPCLFKCKRSLFNTERICHFRTAVEE